MIQFRCDKELKQEATELYESLGLDLPTAFRIFLKQSILSRGIPFSVTIPNDGSGKSSVEKEGMEIFNALRKQAEDFPEMSMEEILSDIAEFRKMRRKGA